MASHYKTDGTAARVQPANGPRFTLAELQGLVGGYIEVGRRWEDGRVLLVNEEGRIRGLRVNVAATVLTDFDFPIVGDAVLLEKGEFD